MKTLKFAAIAISLAAAETAFAGGLLTNTNQNVAFLRNPARDAAIGIDGVYSNPAGVAFLGDGLHLSINLQNAHQTRTVTTGFPLFVYNANNPARQAINLKEKPTLPSFHRCKQHGTKANGAYSSVSPSQAVEANVSSTEASVRSSRWWQAYLYWLRTSTQHSPLPACSANHHPLQQNISGIVTAMTPTCAAVSITMASRSEPPAS